MCVALAVYINVSGLCRLPLEDCGNRTAPSQFSACGRAPSLEASLRRVMHNAMSSNICQEFTCAWGATSIRFIYLSYLLFLLTEGTSSICYMQTCIWRTLLLYAEQCIKISLCYLSLTLQNRDFDMSVLGFLLYHSTLLFQWRSTAHQFVESHESGEVHIPLILYFISILNGIE